MRRNISMVDFGFPSYIIVNGKRMTTEEYNALRKAKKEETEKKKAIKRNQSLIKVLPPYIAKIVKNNKQMKSLSAYYDNGYRQWGNVAKEIINMEGISAPFVRFRLIIREVDDLLNTIAEIGKKGDKDMFQYVEKLAYKIDDAKTTMENLMEGISASKVCYTYKDKECINGVGRRLGLQILLERSWKSAMDMDDTIKELAKIALEGDETAYKENGSFNRL